MIVGRSARGLSTSMSSQNLGGAPQLSKKGVASLTPTLSLKNINVNVPQTEITPCTENAKVDEIEGKTSSPSVCSKDATVKYSPSEPPGSGTPGLWLGSKRSPGRVLDCIVFHCTSHVFILHLMEMILCSFICRIV